MCRALSGKSIAPASAHRPSENGLRSVRTRPPGRVCASSTVTSCPQETSSYAAVRPASPAPRTITLRGCPARGGGGSMAAWAGSGASWAPDRRGNAARAGRVSAAFFRKRRRDKLEKIAMGSVPRGLRGAAGRTGKKSPVSIDQGVEGVQAGYKQGDRQGDKRRAVSYTCRRFAGEAETSMQSNEIELIYELSPMQQAMLFHTLYAPGSGVYVLQMSLRLTGRLDLPAFERAWRQVVERHGILRTAFFWENLEKPLQVVYRQADLEVARTSWSGLGADEQRARLARSLDADRERGFDLSQAPLMRLALFELGPDLHQLVWTQHHLVVDGWSQGVILRELFVSYAELSQGREPRRERPRGFREYIAWLQRQDPGEAESFWRQSLAGFSSPTLLAEGDDKAGGSGAAARRELLALPRETAEALREVARRHRLTLNTLVQGAWAVLLAQATGRQDVLFGATVAGRPPELPGVESIVGPFINTLPVRVGVAPESRLREWLGSFQERLAAMRRHEQSSLVDMQRWSELPGGVPLFDHILVFENLALPQELSQQLPDLAIEEEAAATRTNYPLNVVVIPGAELALTILYDAGRFETAAVTRLLERLAHLLTVFAEDRNPALAELPALPPAERQQLLEWNDTGAAPASDLCLHELFAAQAERTPQAVALVHETERTTYAELVERAGGLARQLRAMGVGLEVRVAVCLERSPDLIASLLGVLAAGGAYVPVDPADPVERQQWMLEDSGAAVLVTRGRLLVPPLPGGRECGWERGPGGEGLRRLDLETTDIPNHRLPRGTGTTPDHLAYVIYTSGSTGRPKGVAIEHRSAVALARWARDAFSDEELSGVLAATSVCFDLSVFEIFAPLAWGGRVILAENALALPGLPAADEVRLLNTVPPVAAELLRAGLPAPVRTACLAGEPLPAALAARLYETGTVDRVLNLYGPSEDTTYSTGALVPRPGAGREHAPAIGRPLPGTRTWVVDRRGELVPIGVAGELWLAGADRGTVHPGSLRPIRDLRREGLPHGRPGAPPAGRRPGVPGPARRPDQDPRLPHRARRDRGGAGAPSGGAGVHGAGAARCAGRSPPGGLRGGPGRPGAARRGPAGVVAGAAAAAHGALRLRGARGPAALPERQAGPAGAPGAGADRRGRGSGLLRRSGRPGRGAARPHLVRAPGRRADRRPRELLRPRRALPAGHPGDLPHPDAARRGAPPAPALRVADDRGPRPRDPGEPPRPAGPADRPGPPRGARGSAALLRAAAPVADRPARAGQPRLQRALGGAALRRARRGPPGAVLRRAGAAPRGAAHDVRRARGADGPGDRRRIPAGAAAGRSVGSAGPVRSVGSVRSVRSV